MVNFDENRTESRRDDWRTPVDMFNALDEVFGFQVDLAALPDNRLAQDWCGPGGIVEDTLDADPEYIGKAIGADMNNVWCWCNPPYQRGTNKKWASKLMDFPNVVILHQSCPSARWYDHFWNGANAICFIRGRINFDGQPTNAPFESALIVKGDLLSKRQIDRLSAFGPVVDLDHVRKFAGDDWKSHVLEGVSE